MTPFITPVKLGPLRVAEGATQYQISLTKTLHEKATQTFQTYQLVQRALVQQVLEAIDSKYLSSICNRVTDQVPDEIHELILHLFRLYGKITPQHLRATREAVEQMNYTTDEPISIIFDAVEDLVEIAELVGRPYSPDQIVNIGYIILSKNRIFISDIREWTRRPEDEKTRPNLILSFTEAFQELRNTVATVDELGFHSAKAIVSQNVEQLRN